MTAITSERRTLPLNHIKIDETIYPREGVDPKRVARYTAIMRDGDVAFPTIEVQHWPADKQPDLERYRILDGAHRLHAYRDLDLDEVEAIVVHLNGADPILYAASKAIGPANLKEKEAEDVAIRAYENNHDLTSAEIGRAVGRSRDSIDDYIRHLRARDALELDLKIFKMDRLGIPQDRIAARLGVLQSTVHEHLLKMGTFPFSINSDLARGFHPADIAEKYSWPQPLVWSVALEGKSDKERFETLKWGLRAYDLWGFNDVDKRFGDDWPGRIPAQLVAHALYYFTDPNDLVFDPMAGGGVVPDTCLAFGRRCWSFDSSDRPDDRPEIEPYTWNLDKLDWPFPTARTKPDLIFLDPPYFDKMDSDYQEKAEGSISGLSRGDYLQFYANWFSLAREQSKASTRVAFLNADWRDYQGRAARDENPANAITMVDYAHILDYAGWEITHFIDCPLSSERLAGAQIAAMQERRTIGVIRRTLMMARRK